jgi:hypothetical protein
VYLKEYSLSWWNVDDVDFSMEVNYSMREGRPSPVKQASFDKDSFEKAVFGHFTYFSYFFLAGAIRSGLSIGCTLCLEPTTSAVHDVKATEKSRI